MSKAWNALVILKKNLDYKDLVELIALLEKEVEIS